MTTRDSYVETFGEGQAVVLEAAADMHKNGIHDYPGSDPFRWAIAIAIGYQCAEVDRYRESHGITVPFEDWRTWVRDHGDLEHHDGDSDYLGLFAGAYQPFIPAFDDAEPVR